MKRLLIAVIAFTPGLQAATQYVAAGVVVDSQTHKPIANAHVSLAPTTQRARQLELVTTQDGRFSFVVGQPGKYTLQMYKVGYARQAYRQSEFSTVSSAIVLRDDQDTNRIVFEAKRGGIIAGQLKDENADPIGGAQVTILQSMVAGGGRRIVMLGQTHSNAAGEFRFYNLRRGNYYVCAAGSPWFANSVLALQQAQEQYRNLPRRPDFVRLGSPNQATTQNDGDQPQPIPPPYSPDPNFRGTAYPLTFYPAAQNFDEASVVHLETGGQARISLTLPYAHAVSVNGSVVFPGQTSTGLASLYKKIRDQYIMLLTAPVTPDGKFHFQNVASGSYEISAASASSSGPSSWYVLQQIEVGSVDSEVSLNPDSLGALSGRVVIEGAQGGDLPAWIVSLRDDRGRFLRVQADPEGNFTFNRLPMGRYEVGIVSKEYIAAYLTGANSDRLPLQVDVSTGEPIHRDLTLTRAVSSIEGVVEKNGTAQAGAFVLLAPKDPSEMWAYRVDQSDSDGSFGLATIPSGDYYLIALSDGAEVEYRNPKVAPVLAKFARPIHIDSGEHLAPKIELVDTAPLHLP